MSIKFRCKQIENDNICLNGLRDMPSGMFLTFSIDYKTLTPEQKIVYDNFFSLQNNKLCTIINTSYNFQARLDINHSVNDSTLELDYNTMSVEDKAKVDAFEALL